MKVGALRVCFEFVSAIAVLGVAEAHSLKQYVRQQEQARDAAQHNTSCFDILTVLSLTKMPVLRLVNQDLGRLDDGFYLIANLQTHRIRRSTRDRGDDLELAHLDDDFGHDVAQLDGLDDSGELIARAEHG